ncbi:tRNAisopentenyltransferase 2 isoform X2 [Tasmannia lanceolata]|uniref:tRNAisopentenyltransferase 2 isoform X2 n=1 Tax=Tasmannia lanceolata TaxID=3420 RepID=UPI00406411EF
MEEGIEDPVVNPNPNPNPRKAKVVVVMGATGSGKSRLAIDLASFFPVEILNADSMQVYEGLDVLTNKVPIKDQKGVPHHLLGSISTDVDFTSKDFRDLAIPIINDILSRNHLPIVVGGTNYYIQALVSSFLLDESIEDMDDNCPIPVAPLGDLKPNFKFDRGCDDLTASFDLLKKLDPAAANRVHPNDYRKVQHYLRLYASSGVPPSKLFQGKASEKWSRADNFRYDCCFIWVDASLPVLDRYVDQRVDCMIDAGLLKEVYDIYNPNTNYTRGLRQAIGVREFDDILRLSLSNNEAFHPSYEENDCIYGAGVGIAQDANLKALLDSDDNKLKMLLSEAIDKLKVNTRRLVRRQKRRLNRLRTFFGWDLHYVDATEAFLCMPWRLRQFMGNTSG